MISRRSVLKLGLLAAAPTVLPVGCYVHTVRAGWQPLAGEEHFTRRGFSFWWLHGTARYPTPEIAAEEIDRLYVEWNFWYTSTYGGNPWQLLIRLQAVDIQLIPWSEIPGNDEELVEVGIYWNTHNQIDIAMRSPMRFDATIGFWSSGIDGLRHEWTHVIRGNFHA